MILEYIDSFFTHIINIRNRFTTTFIGSIKNNKIQQYSYSNILPVDVFKLFIEKPYVYKLNDRYHITDNIFTLIPLVEEIKLVKGNDEIIVTNKIKLYDNSFELWIVLFIEKLKDYEKIVITVNKIVSIQEYEFNIDEIKYKKLYEIYNNKI